MLLGLVMARESLQAMLRWHRVAIGQVMAIEESDKVCVNHIGWHRATMKTIQLQIQSRSFYSNVHHAGSGVYRDQR